jgi:hypothetical protein
LEVGLKMQKDAREKKDDIAPGLKRGASVSERARMRRRRGVPRVETRNFLPGNFAAKARSLGGALTFLAGQRDRSDAELGRTAPLLVSEG